MASAILIPVPHSSSVGKPGAGTGEIARTGVSVDGEERPARLVELLG